MSLVAVVDGNRTTRERMARALRSSDMMVAEASDGFEALRAAFAERPDLALIDLAAEGVDGFELIRVLRAACDIPIIALSLDLTPEHTVRALDAGADDVIEKDCNSTELLARVRAAIRRYQRQTSEKSTATRQVTTGALLVDREAQVVTKRGVRIPLTRTEYRLLDAMAARVGQVAPHRYLLATVWGDEYVDDTHYLRVYVGYLRSKLEDDPSQPRYLVNEWGTGYRLASLPIEDDVLAAARADGELVAV